MSQRTELKFYVPLKLYVPLGKALIPYTEADANVSEGQARYKVNSIYYDTEDFLYYRKRVAGTPERLKFRIRYYGDETGDLEQSVWFELKQKFGFFQRKLRHRVRAKDVGPILRGEQEHPELRSHLFEYNLRNLRPVVKVSYFREPLKGIFEWGTRITFDSEIKGAYTNEFTTMPLSNEKLAISPFYFVLEVKLMDSIPTWLSHIIESFGLEQIVFSKYTKSIDHCQIIRRLKGEDYDF